MPSVVYVLPKDASAQVNHVIMIVILDNVTLELVASQTLFLVQVIMLLTARVDVFLVATYKKVNVQINKHVMI
jgi:hypothetical protein